MIDRAAFISAMTPIANDEELRSGIKPLISITQAAHESGWGSSELTRKANNLFGFTGEAWEASGKPVIKLPTKEYVSTKWVTVYRPFRSYSSWSDSIRDWSNLMHYPRYKYALTAAIEGNLLAFASEVAKAGYATDPDYTKALMSVGTVVEPMLQKPL